MSYEQDAESGSRLTAHGSKQDAESGSRLTAHGSKQDPILWLKAHSSRLKAQKSHPHRILEPSYPPGAKCDPANGDEQDEEQRR